MLKEHKSLSVRGDLENCEIAICASYVPTIFTDNFDYQTYDDFIKGVLIDEEVMYFAQGNMGRLIVAGLDL